jgi:hypothetical protein
MLNDDWRRELLGQGFKYQTRNAAKALMRVYNEGLGWDYIEEQIKDKKFHLGEGRVYCEFVWVRDGVITENFTKSLNV